MIAIDLHTKEDLWDSYYMGVPERQRQPVEQYKISQESIAALAERYTSKYFFRWIPVQSPAQT